MPHYYLHVCCDQDARDEEGVVRPDLDAAKTEAIMGAREIVAAQVMAGKPVDLTHRVLIADDSGAVLDAVAFQDVLIVRDSGPDYRQAG